MAVVVPMAGSKDLSHSIAGQITPTLDKARRLLWPIKKVAETLDSMPVRLTQSDIQAMAIQLYNGEWVGKSEIHNSLNSDNETNLSTEHVTNPAILGANVFFANIEKSIQPGNAPDRLFNLLHAGLFQRVHEFTGAQDHA
ncbi:hypothetical protein A8V48_21395 [Yersinia pestis]|nr:hypothetical protein A8V48_21395 [Yersinia pestis]